MTTNFRINGTDFDDLFVRKDLFTEGGLWSFGYNFYGQLGNNTTTNRSSPVQTIAGGTNWKYVSVSNELIAAIKTDGTLWSWGRNNLGGQLGDNTIINKSSPVQTISAGTNWKQVSCGEAHTAAIKTDGTLWLWGYNLYSQLGDGSVNISKSSPIQTVSGGANWRQVSCGGQYTTAIKTDGTLWLWGENSDGQLGDNTIIHRSSPVQTVSGGTNWKQVSSGGNHTAAIKTDGTLWLWGRNSLGQLGDNTRTTRSSPVQTVSTGTNWKQVSCGYLYTAAIKTDGTLWLWGINDFGQLGTNDLVHRSSPIQTVSGGTNWKQVSCGEASASIKIDGTLWLWGRNTEGQLGDNTIISKSSPIQTVSGGTNWKQVSVNRYATSAIRGDYWA